MAECLNLSVSVQYVRQVGFSSGSRAVPIRAIGVTAGVLQSPTDSSSVEHRTRSSVLSCCSWHVGLNDVHIYLTTDARWYRSDVLKKSAILSIHVLWHERINRKQSWRRAQSRRQWLYKQAEAMTSNSRHFGGRTQSPVCLHPTCLLQHMPRSYLQ